MTVATVALMLAACESTILPPGIEASDPAGVVDLTPPASEVAEEVPASSPTDVTAVGPECLVDDDCTRDDACPGPGGCDGDPCRDDRCVLGQCLAIDVPGCDPRYMIEYTYAACCATRTLTLAPDGRCTFRIEGTGSARCDDVTPGYVQRLVEHASMQGFFEWDTGHCVPGETSADFALHMRATPYDHTVSCEEGVCVGELCNILDGVWATLPSNWHDGCGCE
jgi:hypothetical protein